VGVAINTAAIEQHHSIVLRVARHLSLNLTTESACTGAVIADARLIIQRSFRVVIVIQDELGVGVHEQAGQQGPMGTDSLLTPPGSLNNGTMIGPHALGSDNIGRIERAGVCGGITVPSGHRVRRGQRTCTAIQVLEQRLGIFLSQKLVKVAGGINAVPRVIALSCVAELMSKGLDVRAVAGGHSFSLVFVGNVVEFAEDTADEVSRQVLVKEWGHCARLAVDTRRLIGGPYRHP
jgi:hypothetical protein